MEDLANRHAELNLTKDDRFTLTLSGLKAKAGDEQAIALLAGHGKMQEDQVRDLMKASDTLVLERLDLVSAQDLELQLREHGIGYEIRLDPVTPGSRTCSFHGDRPDADRCRLCNRFVCAECRSLANQAPICPKCKEVIVVGLEQETLTTGLLAGGMAAAAAAAIVGGIIWGAICIATGLQIGYVAWGLGFLVGYATVIGARGARGFPLQVTAVVASVLGILVGKYVMFYSLFTQFLLQKLAAAGAPAVSYGVMLSPSFFKLFVQMLPKMLGGYDLLWVFLAVSTAWSMPAPSQIRIEESR